MENNCNLQFCTVEEVVAAAYLRLDIEDSRDEIVFTEWSYDALREIGPGPEDINVKCVAVEDLCFSKPVDMMGLIDLQLIGTGNRPYFYQFSQNRILGSEIQGTNTTVSTSTNGGGESSIIVSEQDRTFVLSSNAGSITKAELSYFTFPVTEEGDMKIRENLKLSIIAYIEWQYYKRERNRTRRLTKTAVVPMNEIDFYKTSWIQEMRKSKGRSKMPNAVSAELIGRKWNSLIPNWKDSKRNSGFRVTR